MPKPFWPFCVVMAGSLHNSSLHLSSQQGDEKMTVTRIIRRTDEFYLPHSIIRVEEKCVLFSPLSIFYSSPLSKEGKIPCEVTGYTNA